MSKDTVDAVGVLISKGGMVGMGDYKLGEYVFLHQTSYAGFRVVNHRGSHGAGGIHYKIIRRINRSEK